MAYIQMSPQSHRWEVLALLLGLVFFHNGVTCIWGGRDAMTLGSSRSSPCIWLSLEPSLGPLLSSMAHDLLTQQADPLSGSDGTGSSLRGTGISHVFRILSRTQHLWFHVLQQAETPRSSLHGRPVCPPGQAGPGVEHTADHAWSAVTYVLANATYLSLLQSPFDWWPQWSSGSSATGLVSQTVKWPLPHARSLAKPPRLPFGAVGMRI